MFIGFINDFPNFVVSFVISCFFSFFEDGGNGVQERYNFLLEILPLIIFIELDNFLVLFEVWFIKLLINSLALFNFFSPFNKDFIVVSEEIVEIAIIQK